MSLDTYTNLKAAVARWVRRTDLTDDIPDFIRLFEAEAQRRLRGCPAMMTNTSETIAAETLGLPADFLAVRSFRLTTGSSRELSPFTEEQAQSYKAVATQVPGEPRGYTVRGGSFEFTPTPDQSYTASLTYEQMIPPLASNSSNWLLTGFPQAYLYGSLTQAAPFLKQDARIVMWGTLYEQALADVRASNRTTYAPQLSVDPGLRSRRWGFNINAGDY